MISTLKQILISAVLVIVCLPAVANAAPVTAPKPDGGINMTDPVAANPTCGAGDSTPKGQILQGAGQSGADCTGTGVNKAVQAAVNVLSLVVGVAAVIMIIISGFKYVTSGGDSNGISSAKNTLVYALVGLAIAATAQTLVHFVLNKVR